MRVSSTPVGEANASPRPRRSYHLQRLRNALRQQRRRWRLALHRTRLSVDYARSMREAAVEREADDPSLAAIYRHAAACVLDRLPQARADIHALRRRVVSLEAAL